jgi:hypothetical protein
MIGHALSSKKSTHSNGTYKEDLEIFSAEDLSWQMLYKTNGTEEAILGLVGAREGEMWGNISFNVTAPLKVHKGDHFYLSACRYFAPCVH